MSETAVAAERNREPESSKTIAGLGLVTAHIGMRGLLAFYIMLFHALAFSTGWDVHGSALMPVLFLVAGYSPAIVYGKRPGLFNADYSPLRPSVRSRQIAFFQRASLMFWTPFARRILRA